MTLWQVQTTAMGETHLLLSTTDKVQARDVFEKQKDRLVVGTMQLFCDDKLMDNYQAPPPGNKVFADPIWQVIARHAAGRHEVVHAGVTENRARGKFESIVNTKPEGVVEVKLVRASEMVMVHHFDGN